MTEISFIVTYNNQFTSPHLIYVTVVNFNIPYNLENVRDRDIVFACLHK